jgi:hypothetical protein
MNQKKLAKLIKEAFESVDTKLIVDRIIERTTDCALNYNRKTGRYPTVNQIRAWIYNIHVSEINRGSKLLS